MNAPVGRWLLGALALAGCGEGTLPYEAPLVCIDDELCVVYLPNVSEPQSSTNECWMDIRLSKPLDERAASNARCVLRALRDRTNGTVVLRHGCI
jgi:hypothetical protein